MATFEDADPGTQSKAQRFYAIYDKLNDDSDLPLSKSDLTEKEITKQNTNHGYRKVNHHKRSLVEPSTTPSHKDRGWYLTLKKPGSKHNGERVIVSPVYRNGMIMFTTTFPSAGSACSTAYAEGYMMILDSKTGNNVLDLEVGENDVRVVAGQTISTGTSAFSNLRAKGGYTESDKLYHSKEDNGTIQDMSLGSRMMYNRSSWRVLD